MVTSTTPTLQNPLLRTAALAQSGLTFTESPTLSEVIAYVLKLEIYNLTYFPCW